jgi:hypothetical protein
MKTRKSFSQTLKAVNRKTDNHAAALEAKVAIRQRVLDDIGAGDARVFDAFAGEGQLYDRVWQQAGEYTGCDRVWYRDDRLMFVADSRRVLRALDLARFNIFDLDAYGSPWEHVAIICARRPMAPGERIGLVFTEGSGLKVKMGQLPFALAVMAGLRATMPGTARAFNNVLDRAILGTCRRLSCRVALRLQAKGKTGAAVHYVGLVLEGAAA